MEAIDTLSAMVSNDPAAADALRTIRLTRRNLEDHWMPVLRDIERSTTMAQWRASRLTTFGSRPLSSLAELLPDHLRPGGMASMSIPVKRRDQLLRRLDFLERRVLAGDEPASNDDLRALGLQLAFWVGRDEEFADVLIERSTTNMLVGHLLGKARFSTAFARQIARRMAVPNGPDNGVDHGRYASSLGAVLASLTNDPDACLDLLLDKPTTYALAAWDDLDAGQLSDFVVSGLHTAIAAEPTRLADGYSVLAFLTSAANGPLDDGMSAGMATGVAASLPGYIDTLAPAIAQEGASPVVIRSVSPSVELGTYDDLVDLFGAVVRVPEAQSALGATIAAYTFDTFERVGGNATRRPDVTHLADVADLIGDASRNEHAELVMAAAVEEARRRQLGGLIGFGANVGLLAGGAGSVARAIAGQTIRAATNSGSSGEPERLAGDQIPAQTYALITVAAIAVTVSEPSIRHDAGLDDVTARQWIEAERRIDHIELLDDKHERVLAIGDLEHWIGTSVPALAAYLLEVRKMPGVSELKEGRNAVGTD